MIKMEEEESQLSDTNDTTNQPEYVDRETIPQFLKWLDAQQCSAEAKRFTWRKYTRLSERAYYRWRHRIGLYTPHMIVDTPDMPEPEPETEYMSTRRRNIRVEVIEG